LSDATMRIESVGIAYGNVEVFGFAMLTGI
jgi:hypothetical protein